MSDTPMDPAKRTWLIASSCVGAVGGALMFGYLTDRLGRRKLFMATLGVYQHTGRR